MAVHFQNFKFFKKYTWWFFLNRIIFFTFAFWTAAWHCGNRQIRRWWLWSRCWILILEFYSCSIPFDLKIRNFRDHHQKECQLGYIMMLIWNDICQYEGRYATLNKNICHFWDRRRTRFSGKNPKLFAQNGFHAETLDQSFKKIDQNL